MRQLGDLIVWAGMIGLAVGVVYYTPIVAEYVATERKPRLAAIPLETRADADVPRAIHAPGEWRGGR